MKHFPVAAALIPGLLLAACAGQTPHVADRGPRIKPHTDPGVVVATEIAFAQSAQTKGQWTAFRAYADPRAELFMPQRVLAAVWLKGRADPAKPALWQPYQVWSSCDGSIAVTHGGWNRGEETGYFTTVWARQTDGSYKLLLDSVDKLAMPLPAPEMIAAKSATCSGAPGVALIAPDVGVDFKQIVARDQSLQISSSVNPDGARQIILRLWDGKVLVPMLDETVAAGH